MHRQPFFTIALLVAVSFFSGRGISEAQEGGPSIREYANFIEMKTEKILKMISIALLLVVIQGSYADKVMPVKQIIPMEIPVEDIPNNSYERVGVNIYDLEISSQSIRALILDAGLKPKGYVNTYFNYMINNHLMINYSFAGKMHDIVSEGRGGCYESALINDASSVWIDGKQVALPDTYVKDHWLHDTWYPEYYGKKLYKAFAIKNYDVHRIVGIIQENVDTILVEYFGVWSYDPSETNDCKLDNLYTLEKPETSSDPFFIQGEFALDGQFFLIREFVQEKSFYFGEYDNPYGYAHVYPGAFLYEFNTGRFCEVERDVDFSHDGEFFVTERDDMPTLVDVETDENMLRYDMPVVMMAACFSPDDRTLYIAGEDNQLYVFDAGLQASAAENWPLYH